MKLQAKTFIYTTDDGKRYDVYFTKKERGYVASVVHNEKILFNQGVLLANADTCEIILKKLLWKSLL